MVVGTEEFSIILIMPLKKTRQGRVLFLDTRIIEVCFGLIFSFSHSVKQEKELENFNIG